MSSGPLDGCCELLFQRRLRLSMHLFAQLSPEFGHCIHLAFGRAVAFFEHAKFDSSQHVEQDLSAALVHRERVRNRRDFLGSGLFRFGHRPSIARWLRICEAGNTKSCIAVVDWYGRSKTGANAAVDVVDVTGASDTPIHRRSWIYRPT